MNQNVSFGRQDMDGDDSRHRKTTYEHEDNVRMKTAHAQGTASTPATLCPEVEDWFERLVRNGAKIAHDAGAAPHYMHQVEIDEVLARKGREFFMSHFFMIMVNMFIGLYSILYVPNIARILKITERSGSTHLAFQRYLSTLTHAMQWFKESEELKKSLKQVLTFHQAGSFKGQKDGMNKTGRKEISSGITQLDMVVTQFGFIGPALVFNNRVPFYNKYESEEGFVYVMYLEGKCLGILDQFNLCTGDVRQTKQRCRLVLAKILQPCLQKRNPVSEEMTFHLLNGINVLNPLIIEKDFKLFSEKLLLEEDFSVENPSSIYTLYLFFFQKVLYMPGMCVLRVVMNSLLMYNIWLADQWKNFIIQSVEASQFKEHTLYDRFVQILNIPVFSVISVTSYLVNEIRKRVLSSGKLGACLGCILALCLVKLL